MSDILNRLLAKKVLGADAPSNAAGNSQEDAKPNPLIASIMKSMGISPESITAYADGVKNAVTDKLSDIDSKLAQMLDAQQRVYSMLLTLESKQNEIERNLGVLLDDSKAAIEAEAQAVVMASHPLSEPITS